MRWLKRWKGVEGQARLFCWLVACGLQPPITPNKSTSLCPSHFSSFLSFWWRFSGPTKERLSWVGLPPRFGLVGAAFHSFHSIVIHKFKFFIPFQTLNLFISFHFIHFTHKLSGPPIQSHSFHSINCSFDFSNWWWNERLWAHYTATDLRQQIKNYSTIS